MPNPKKTNRDYPLATTPEIKIASDSTPQAPHYFTRKEYKQQLKQAKREHNIDAASKGTLGTERIAKIKGITSVVGDVIGTAASAKSLIGSGKGQSGAPYKR
jgi:hypothetical protein